MKRIRTCLLITALALLAAPGLAQDEPFQPPAPVDEAPPPGDHPRPPARDIERPNAPPDWPRLDEQGPRPVHPEPRWAPLMRMLRERRPDLAERLDQLRRNDPERFEQVLMEAFLIRLEHSLQEAEHAPERPLGGRDLQPGLPEEHRRPPQGEMDRARFELQQRNETLEVRSHELADQVRELQQRDAPREELDAQRRALSETVNEQFDVRAELRRLELATTERHMQQLRERIDQLRGALERREREREAIIERRVRQLLGEGFEGW